MKKQSKMEAKRKENKLFVVRKYVWGISAKDVLHNEKKIDAHECWIDEDWKRNQQAPKDAIGFSVEKNGQ